MVRLPFPILNVLLKPPLPPHFCTMTLSLIQQPAKLILSRQPVVFKVQSNSAEIPLRLEGSISGFSGDSIQADAQKKAVFELSDYLQGLVTERGNTAATPVIYTAVPKEVTFSFKEYAGDPAVAGTELVTDTYYVLEGSVPKPRRKVLYAANASLLSYLILSKSCLSWWPVAEAKRIIPTQKEFINYLQVYSQSPVTITLNLRLSFTDGSYSNIGALFTVASVAYMRLVYFPTGYADLGIAALAAQFTDKTLAFYSVTVNYGPPNHSDAISSAYTYIIDTGYFQNPRTLYLRNAFGLLEILLCTGLGEQENAIKPELAVTDGQLLPDKLAWKVTKSDSVSVNTGFLSSAQTQWLSDLLDTTEAYELIGSNLHPIVFKDISISPVHDNDFIFSADLQYEYAYSEVIETGE